MALYLFIITNMVKISWIYVKETKKSKKGWNKKNIFNENEYDKLYTSGSAPAPIYRTPKIHKFSSSDSFPKLHPMVSSIGTFNYNLARFLWDLLSPLVPNDYSCNDTFLWKISCLNSLFTNMLLHETINTAINLIFNHNPNLDVTKKNLKKFSFLLHHRLIFFLTVNVLIKLMD